MQPIASASATGAVSFRYSDLSGTFTPSPDGFETEFTADTRLYRWIDKVSNQRLEARQFYLSGDWNVNLYDDSRTELGYYPYGIGEGFGDPLASFNVDNITVTTQRGTVADKSIAITFTSKSSTPGSQMVSGTLEGSAKNYLWGAFELPRSSAGTLTWNGKTRTVMATTVYDGLTVDSAPELFASLDDGSSITARLSNTPTKIIETRTPTLVVEFQCGSPLGGACDYTAVKNGTRGATFNFSTVVYKGSRYGVSTLLEGNIAVGQQYSTLTVNDDPFELKSGNFGTAVVSSVSSVGDTTRFSFSSSSQTVAGGISVWRRGEKIVQILIPSANGSQFICTEIPSDSRANMYTQFDPSHTIPACPAVTALFPIGGNVRGFEFKDFSLNAAPSNYAVPTVSIMLNGILMAKGL